MKVGTDGTLLGAWAHGGQRILDIGTGTGLIALMMAQRYETANVTGIEIDADACRQASENVCASPFAERVEIVEKDICQFRRPHVYDAIVSNPPYFDRSLECPDGQRTMARHTSSLSYRNLMESAWRLLDEAGELSVVIPSECKSQLESEALLAGFFKWRECSVKTTPRKPARRFLMAFGKHAASVEYGEGVIETKPGVRSEWYVELTKDFYL